MSEKNKPQSDELMTSLFGQHAEKMLVALNKSNRHACKRNRLAKQQFKQSLLNYEQVERQYLIEKSNLQPTFRLSVNEFLLSAPDGLNDPELASEAKYLADLGMSLDEHIVKIRVRAKGDAEYRRPSMVMGELKRPSNDERAHSIRELLYFVSMDKLKLSKAADCFVVFFIYRDKTTLPVIHKYKVHQQQGAALSGWDVTHLDTFFMSSHDNLSALNTSKGCAELFLGRDDD